MSKTVTYHFYFLGGKLSKATGRDVADAFRNAVYEGGEINVLDFYSVTDEPTHEWDATKKSWVKK